MEQNATKIKICGIRRFEDISYINDAKPDYIGFIFVKGRKRYVEPLQAQALRKKLSDGIKAVGVFIDESPEVVAKIVKSGIIDAVQLHGSEDNGYIAELRRLLEKKTAPQSMEKQAGEQNGRGMPKLQDQDRETFAECSEIPVIQAFLVKTAEDLRRAKASEADYLLLDSGAGTGQTFDWSVVEEAGGMDRPFFLAGGLGPDNIKEAIWRIHPFAVDMSSGVETDGVKDGEKIAAVVHAVRGQLQPMEMRERVRVNEGEYKCQKEDTVNLGDSMSPRR